MVTPKCGRTRRDLTVNSHAGTAQGSQRSVPSVLILERGFPRSHRHKFVQTVDVLRPSVADHDECMFNTAEVLITICRYRFTLSKLDQRGFLDEIAPYEEAPGE
jgi:hypothetical protein